jgi:uncharacterized protein (TIGR00730 family)
VAEPTDADRAQIERILESPEYRVADRDLEFLHSDGMRGERLALDYEKAEVTLTEHRIEHAIVVFGSARLREPSVAAAEYAAARAAAEAAPGNTEALRAAAIAARRLEASRYYEEARDFGRLVGRAPQGPGGERVVIMTGGGPGLMEAANRGASDVGASTVGLNIMLPHEQLPNPYVTPGLCLSFHYFATRKFHFLRRARALVAFPGGYGTLDELFETLTLIQTRKMTPVPIVLVGRAFWTRLIDFDFLVDEGFLAEADLALFRYAETAADAWAHILDWHDTRGSRCLPGAPTG